MKKEDIIKIIVVLVALGFLTDQFYFGQAFRQSPSGGPVGENVTGTVLFNGTIRTYDPVLGFSANASQSVIAQLRSYPGVKDVKVQPDSILVETETRDDVYPIAVFLRQNNVTAYSMANIAIPPTLELDLSNGTMNVSAMNGIVRVEAEPLVDADNEVTVYMVAIAQGGQLVAYHSARIMMNKVTLHANVTVDALNHKLYTYSIPWESRNSVDASSGTYAKMDTILFSSPLNVSQIVAKRSLPYVVYIDANTAQVSPELDNSTQVMADFEGIDVVFPQSTLTILTNDTPAELPYNSTVRYSYVVGLPETIEGYDAGVSTLVMESDVAYELNSTTEIEISGLAMGNKLVSFSS